MESWLDWLWSSLESMCIRIAFPLCKSHLFVQCRRHAALQVRVCPGYHGNRFRHCRPTADLNPRSRENQIRFGNFCKKKRLTVHCSTGLLQSHVIIHFISNFEAHLHTTDAWAWNAHRDAYLPTSRSSFWVKLISALSFSSVTVFHPHITILWPRLCRITILQEIQHETLSQDRHYDTLLCCVLQAAEFPAQHLSVEFQEILRLSCFGSCPCILNADTNSHLLVQPGLSCKATYNPKTCRDSLARLNVGVH